MTEFIMVWKLGMWRVYDSRDRVVFQSAKLSECEQWIDMQENREDEA